MKPHHVILVLLIAALAASDLAGLAYVTSTAANWPDIPGVILFASTFGQIALLAAWLVFANWNLALRALIAVPTVLGLSFVAAGAIEGSERSVTPWFTIALIAFCWATFPLAAARWFRFQISPPGEVRPAARTPVWQFSIWGLLSITAAVAIVLGTARQLDMPAISVGQAFCFYTCLTATGLLVMGVSMGIRVPELAALVTIPAVTLVCPFLGLLMAASGASPRPDLQQWTLFGVCYGATIAVAVLVVRTAGYRLRRGPFATSVGPGAADPGDGAADPGALVPRSGSQPT